MRTDSTRVSDDAIEEVRGFIGEKYGAQYLPPAPNIYKSKKDAQDAHEAIRPTSVMRTPDEIERHLARRRAEAVPADLDAFRGVADDAGGVRSDHDRRHRQGVGRRRVHLPRHRIGAEVRRLPAGLRRRQGPEGRRRRGAEAQAAAGGGGREAEVPRHQAGAALHRAAAALQRSHAGEEAGSRRRGPAVHLRLDSLDHSGTRVRHQGRRQVQADRAGDGGDRPAARELQRHLRRASTRRAWKRSWTRSKRAKLDWREAMGEFYGRFEKDLEARRRST